MHLGADENGLVRWMADLNTGVVPERPFVIFGQMTTADPTRSPPGTECTWAYTHLPRARHRRRPRRHVGRARGHPAESPAPGFTDRVVARVVQHPTDLEAGNANPAVERSTAAPRNYTSS